jgi:hypothetical protein
LGALSERVLGRREWPARRFQLSPAGSKPTAFRRCRSPLCDRAFPPCRDCAALPCPPRRLSPVPAVHACPPPAHSGRGSELWIGRPRRERDAGISGGGAGGEKGGATRGEGGVNAARHHPILEPPDPHLYVARAPPEKPGGGKFPRSTREPKSAPTRVNLWKPAYPHSGAICSRVGQGPLALSELWIAPPGEAPHFPLPSCQSWLFLVDEILALVDPDA